MHRHEKSHGENMKRCRVRDGVLGTGRDDLARWTELTAKISQASLLYSQTLPNELIY